MRDWAAEAWQQSLGVWADLLKETDASVHGADGQAATQRRSDFAKVNIVFVHLFLDGLADAGIEVEK